MELSILAVRSAGEVETRVTYATRRRIMSNRSGMTKMALRHARKKLIATIKSIDGLVFNSLENNVAKVTIDGSLYTINLFKMSCTFNHLILNDNLLTTPVYKLMGILMNGLKHWQKYEKGV